MGLLGKTKSGESKSSLDLVTHKENVWWDGHCTCHFEEYIITISMGSKERSRSYKYLANTSTTSRRWRFRHMLFGNALAATQGLCAGSHSIPPSNYLESLNYLKVISNQQCLWPQLGMSSSGNYRVRIGPTLLVLVRPY